MKISRMYEDKHTLKMFSVHKHKKIVKVLVKIERLRGDSSPPFSHSYAPLNFMG